MHVCGREETHRPLEDRETFGIVVPRACLLTLRVLVREAGSHASHRCHQ